MAYVVVTPEIRKESNGDISIVVGHAQFQAYRDSSGRCSLALNDGAGSFDPEAGIVGASIDMDAPTLDALLLALREIRDRME